MDPKKSTNPDGTWNQSVTYKNSEQKPSTTTTIKSPNQQVKEQKEKWYKEGDMSHLHDIPPQNPEEALEHIVRDGIQRATGYQAGQKFAYENQKKWSVLLHHAEIL